MHGMNSIQPTFSFIHPNNIFQGAAIMKLLNIRFFPTLFFLFSFLNFNYSRQQPFLERPMSASFFNVGNKTTNVGETRD